MAHGERPFGMDGERTMNYFELRDAILTAGLDAWPTPPLPAVPYGGGEFKPPEPMTYAELRRYWYREAMSR